MAMYAASLVYQHYKVRENSQEQVNFFLSAFINAHGDTLQTESRRTQLTHWHCSPECELSVKKSGDLIPPQGSQDNLYALRLHPSHPKFMAVGVERQGSFICAQVSFDRYIVCCLFLSYISSFSSIMESKAMHMGFFGDPDLLPSDHTLTQCSLGYA